MNEYGFPSFSHGQYYDYPMSAQARYGGWDDPPYMNMYRRVTIVEAMNIALEQVPGEVVKIELEREGGMLFYEVDIVTMYGRKYEVLVDIDSGQIMSVKPD